MKLIFNYTVWRMADREGPSVSQSSRSTLQNVLLVVVGDTFTSDDGTHSLSIARDPDADGRTDGRSDHDCCPLFGPSFLF